MPFYDLECPVCKKVYVDEWFPTVEVRDQWLKHLRCDTCEDLVVVRPSAPSFNVKGFNAKNGYSKEG